MRKRTAAAGAGAVGLAALGLMYLPNMDFGEIGAPTMGDGPLTLDPTVDDDVPPAPTFDGAADGDASDAATGPTGDLLVGTGSLEEPTDAPPIAIADVLVDDREYRVIRRFASDGLPVREPMSLEEALAFAREVPGSPDGVKVRVSRRPNAAAGTASDLMDALAEAGFEADQIDYRTQLVTDSPYEEDGDPSDLPGRPLPE